MNGVVARLRAKNQITLPDEALKAVGAQVGDRILVSVEDGVLTLEPIRTSYYGSMRGVWPADWMEQLRADRDAWRP